MSGAEALLIALAWKSAVLLIAAQAATGAAHRAGVPAAGRHGIGLAVIAALLALPILELSVPHYASLASFATLAGPLSDEGAAAGAGVMPNVDLLGIFEGGGAPSPGWHAAGGPAWLLAAWLCGVLVCGLRSIRDLIAVRALTKAARPVRWEHDCPGSVRVCEADALIAPAASGWLRPIIFFPLAAAKWPAWRREAALRHELAHVRRKDALVQILLEAVRAFYWYNPLIWTFIRRVEIDREFACDEAVLSAGADPDRYANALLLSARDAARAGSSPKMLAMARPSSLPARCAAVLATPLARRLSPLQRGAWIGLPLPLIVALALVGPAAAGERISDSRVRPEHPSPQLLRDARSEFLPADYDALRRRAEAVPAQGSDRRAIEALQNELDRIPHGYGDLVRERATWCLAQVRDGALVSPLMERLGDADWRIGAYAAWCLGVARDPRAMAALRPMLQSANWRTRAMAAFALAAIGSRQSWDDMAIALRDPAWQVRIVAVEYFGASGDPRAAPLLAFSRDDPHAGTRDAAEAAARRLGDRSNAH